MLSDLLPRLLCFSGAGFSAELSSEAARAGDVRLLTPADLYSFGIPVEQEAFSRSRDRRAKYLDGLAES